jgi:hypothetical protein
VSISGGPDACSYEPSTHEIVWPYGRMNLVLYATFLGESQETVVGLPMLDWEATVPNLQQSKWPCLGTQD